MLVSTGASLSVDVSEIGKRVHIKACRHVCVRVWWVDHECACVALGNLCQEHISRTEPLQSLSCHIVYIFSTSVSTQQQLLSSLCAQIYCA